MRLVMFSPRGRNLPRGWPGRIDGDEVVQLAAQTLEAFFTGGGSAREHARFAVADVELRAPVLSPPSIRFFDDERRFHFGNTASIFGPDEAVRVPAGAEARFSIGAVIGADEAIAGHTLVNHWRAPSLQPPKDRDFATVLGPWVATDFRDDTFPWEAARAHAAENTVLRPGDLLVAPPFAAGGDHASVDGLGTLRALAR